MMISKMRISSSCGIYWSSMLAGWGFRAFFLLFGFILFNQQNQLIVLGSISVSNKITPKVLKGMWFLSLREALLLERRTNFHQLHPYSSTKKAEVNLEDEIPFEHGHGFLNPLIHDGRLGWSSQTLFVFPGASLAVLGWGALCHPLPKNDIFLGALFL